MNKFQKVKQRNQIAEGYTNHAINLTQYVKAMPYNFKDT